MTAIVVTSTTGAFRLTLPAGTYVVAPVRLEQASAAGPDLFARLTPHGTRITVSPGETTTTTTLTLVNVQ
jgi:hypothetical protein